MLSDFLEDKEVYFEEYCKKCIHKDLEESEEPCDECLVIQTNLYSHKPICYREKIFIK